MFDAKSLLKEITTVDSLDAYKALEKNLVAIYSTMQHLKLEIHNGEKPLSDEMMEELYSDFLGYSVIFIDLMNDSMKKENIQKMREMVEYFDRRERKEEK